MLTTRCPHCSTVFRIRPEQLSVRGGRVRCGHCQQPFSALAHLEEMEDEGIVLAPKAAVPPAPTPATAPPARPVPVVVPAAPATPKAAPIPVPAPAPKTPPAAPAFPAITPTPAHPSHSPWGRWMARKTCVCRQRRPPRHLRALYRRRCFSPNPRGAWQIRCSTPKRRRSSACPPRPHQRPCRAPSRRLKSLRLAMIFR